ncbi:Type VI secretion system (T6SS), amidase effector protein 4 [Duganella sp. CF517]|uniref:type VI secretion system amidase effector protein Tae4 n=1 Tax=Duganella sp. CF517 TaxID=1881038 RepID=UPI0008D5DEEF|nr:type VI secretion system amidase effector protein Tae4 [Duganella sp. CF517]SEO56742.1 Type VI secretion system (T6SS), amidase effector protein 4 [Duganella sp. CF517]
MTTVLKQHAKVKTNTTKDSVCKIDVPVVRFADLWKSYPKSSPYLDPKTGAPPPGYDNQCAIKVSWAIQGVGVQMVSFKQAAVSVDGKKLAIRAEELAAWLKKQPFCGLPKAPVAVTGKDWTKKIAGRTGILFFKNYWQRDGERDPSGDHIDLWNGSRLTSTGFLGSLETFARFTMGIQSLPRLYSDLGGSSEILFWEIK